MAHTDLGPNKKEEVLVLIAMVIVYIHGHRLVNIFLLFGACSLRALGGAWQSSLGRSSVP